MLALLLANTYFQHGSTPVVNTTLCNSSPPHTLNLTRFTECCSCDWTVTTLRSTYTYFRRHVRWVVLNISPQWHVGCFKKRLTRLTGTAAFLIGFLSVRWDTKQRTKRNITKGEINLRYLLRQHVKGPDMSDQAHPLLAIWLALFLLLMFYGGWQTAFRRTTATLCIVPYLHLCLLMSRVFPNI